MDHHGLPHDQGALPNVKRTSITELLNPTPVAPNALDGQYAANQLPSLSTFVPPPHSQHLHRMPPPYPQQMHPGSSFKLRGASWESHVQAAAAKDDLGLHRADPDPAACRYPPPAPPHHTIYQEAYPRSARPVEEAPTYGMDMPTWTSSSEPPNPPYGPPMISPLYSDERTAISGDSKGAWHAQRPATHQPQADYAHHQQHQQYEQDMAAAAAAAHHHHHQQHQQHQQQQHQQQQYAAANGYFPMSLPDTSTRGTMQHMPMQPPPLPSPRGQPSPQATYYAAHIAYPPQVYASLPAPVAKRVLEQSEEAAPAPKAKRAKPRAKAADGTAGSKRGYNTSKRKEAAQIAAQNAQLMPAVSYSHVPGEKGKDTAAGGSGDDSGAQAPEGTGPLQPELQFARCMSNRYRAEEFPRCVSCTRRWAGDTCRFQGIRYFLKNDKKQIVGIAFVESQKPDAPTMSFPNKWNVSLEKDHTARIKRTVAQALLPTLKKELEHLSLAEVIRRPRESEVRATCDTCMTSIFSSSWMCRLCGREACAECYEQVKELTIDRAGAPEAEIAALQARREKHAHINPFFLTCTRRNEHQAKDFSPMSRFCKAELAEAIAEMEALLKEAEAVSPKMSPIEHALPPPAEWAAASAAPFPQEAGGAAGVEFATPSSFADGLRAGIPPEPSSFAAGTLIASASAAGAPNVPCHDTIHFTDAELTDELFRKVWVRGQPLVVTGLLPKFHVQWSPEYFSGKYGTQSCLILECQTDQNKRVTVGEFFSWFGKYEGRRDCWKLKDWPPSTDFRQAFPELYEDFSNATPVPNFVRRDGVLNLASHFPGNTVTPDLGPKMYNAMASFESQGSKGSTRLHMDMADAVNIMLYAAQTPDARPGCAAWDLFRAEDSPKLRKFLRKKFKGQFQHDPIHSQQFYLDSTLRQELFKEYGVKSHRIYQKPGEAVFIPAGCAHQVCNLADCIKVACDFVSPENIDRCEMLTREFREQNQSMAWKEDVLQLRTMMWFAWLSCRRQEKDVDA